MKNCSLVLCFVGLRSLACCTFMADMPRGFAV
jgi:hypothetical protein